MFSSQRDFMDSFDRIRIVCKLYFTNLKFVQLLKTVLNAFSRLLLSNYPEANPIEFSLK